MMNARLFVAPVLSLVFAAPALPESQLSAAQLNHRQRSRGRRGSDGRFYDCLHQHARQPRRPFGRFPQPDRRRRNLLHRLYGRRNLLRAPPGDGEYLHRHLSDPVAGRKRKVVFDSNRLRASGEPVNTSDLFLMNHDGTELRFLTRGGSPTWSPPGAERRHIEEHRIPRVGFGCWIAD